MLLSEKRKVGGKSAVTRPRSLDIITTVGASFDHFPPLFTVHLDGCTPCCTIRKLLSRANTQRGIDTTFRGKCRLEEELAVGSFFLFCFLVILWNLP